MFTTDLQCPLLLLHAEMWAIDPLIISFIQALGNDSSGVILSFSWMRWSGVQIKAEFVFGLYMGGYNWAFSVVGMRRIEGKARVPDSKEGSVERERPPTEFE